MCTKKYLLVNCVVYPLTPVFLIQAIDLFFGTQEQSSQMFFRISVLKIFENFTGKHLRWSLL